MYVPELFVFKETKYVLKVLQKSYMDYTEPKLPSLIVDKTETTRTVIILVRLIYDNPLTESTPVQTLDS